MLIDYSDNFLDKCNTCNKIRIICCDHHDNAHCCNCCTDHKFGWMIASLAEKLDIKINHGDI